jgi:hypothetical protein
MLFNKIINIVLKEEAPSREDGIKARFRYKTTRSSYSIFSKTELP